MSRCSSGAAIGTALPHSKSFCIVLLFAAVGTRCSSDAAIGVVLPHSKSFFIVLI